MLKYYSQSNFQVNTPASPLRRDYDPAERCAGSRLPVAHDRARLHGLQRGF